jgi:hypothetical protein
LLPFITFKGERLFRVDKRPSAGINMRLLSLNRGVIHGYRHDDHKARNSVE